MNLDKLQGCIIPIVFSTVAWIAVVCLAFQLGKHFG